MFRQFRRICARLGVAGGLLLAVAIFSPTAAQATVSSHDGEYYAENVSGGPPAGEVTCNLNGWVHMCFEPHGDEIWIKDAKRDGYHADVVFWTADTDGTYICHNRHGSAAGWTVCDGLHNLIPEGDYIWLWAWESNSDDDIQTGSGSRLEASTSLGPTSL